MTYDDIPNKVKKMLLGTYFLNLITQGLGITLALFVSYRLSMGFRIENLITQVLFSRVGFRKNENLNSRYPKMVLIAIGKTTVYRYPMWCIEQQNVLR